MILEARPGAKFLPLACTFRISVLPCTSGGSTWICRSKRPGRTRAWSKMSARFVAAMTTTPLLLSKPSISVSSWFLTESAKISKRCELRGELRRDLQRLAATCCDFAKLFFSFFKSFCKAFAFAAPTHPAGPHGLLPLVVALAEARAALPAHCVDLIDEDDAGRGLLGLLEPRRFQSLSKPFKAL